MTLRFRHRTIDVPLPGGIFDIQPIEGEDRQRWVTFSGGGDLHLLDLDAGSADLLVRMHQLREFEHLRLAPDGRLAAVVQHRGQHGVVVDLDAGRVTMTLDRGTYHEEHSDFPAAFAVHEGRTVLIHGTAWNRLDVSDPRTGELLTSRPSPEHPSGAHYLDYFHGRLTVSPNQQWVAEHGWMWHPVGVVTAWSLAAWLRGNVWESEDGPTKRSLCARDPWDGPFCWLDARRLAVYGLGDDEETLAAGACVFDVTTDQEVLSFPGPRGDFFFDERLFSCHPEEGTAVWDAATGARLLHDPDTRPTRYHRSAKTFLSVLPGGTIRLSQLVGQRLLATPAVRLVAAGIASAASFDELPVLADALEEAGCDDAALLEHCRRPGPHGRECWAVNRLLDAGPPSP